ncbi:MAG TPA: pitrilysin family protein [Kofleriaceae bacterium]|nr:pitrilysin family protein [Kofleriaceae bacterium]
MTGPVTIVDGMPRLAADVFTLPCGLEVVLHEDHTVPSCAVWVGYRVGSGDERDGDSGFAHLFEHMFKNSLHLQGRHHYELLREVGATDANAQTGPDRTLYHEVVPRPSLDVALWLESDRMGYFLPGLDQRRLDQQIAVVQAERRQRYENAPYGPERFAVAAGLYPDGHPLRHLTIGRHEDIAAATLERVAAFYRTWYVPANATLVLAGDLDGDEARAACGRWFGSFPPSERPARRWDPTAPQGPVQVVVDDPLAALDRVHRAWHGPPSPGDDDTALDVVALALATPGTGRLWRRLVYERPLAQRVSAWMQPGRRGGEVHVTVDLRGGTSPDEVAAILDDELAEVRARGIDDAALARAVRRREASLWWRLDGLGRRAALLCASMLATGGPDGAAEDLARYLRLDRAAVTAAAARWLDPAGQVEVRTHAGRAAGRARGHAALADPAAGVTVAE